ncbi:hypothetical protein EWE75_24465 [Sphingomonas populi]|uniref:Uncharacterized protein n=1 Tax=Sphingomonas populi TaxID=2484750 RepID=A0A4Q6XFI4_9SPHN|nr:hypothetical protein [Sphingomonas populi]RZF58611.1 hypothetical protein EWE75_24465 [Sphingomonas populi]
MTIFNKRLREATDDENSSFFDLGEPFGNPTGIYVTFLDSHESAEKLATYLGSDLLNDHGIAPFSRAAMFNGAGLIPSLDDRDSQGLASGGKL